MTITNDCSDVIIKLNRNEALFLYANLGVLSDSVMEKAFDKAFRVIKNQEVPYTNLEKLLLKEFRGRFFSQLDDAVRMEGKRDIITDVLN